MKQLKITLKSDMCAGSGESLGNRIDTDICKDSYGFPYIPARRIKGCLRESAEELAQLGFEYATQDAISKLFGSRNGVEGSLEIQDARIQNSQALHSFIEKMRYEECSTVLKEALHPERVAGIYTYRRGLTKLEKGVKVDGSLRFINVLKHYDPMDVKGNSEMVFTALIKCDVSGDAYKLLAACCKSLRHIGMNRNRGLGNVRVEIEDNNSSFAADLMDVTDDAIDNNAKYLLEYRIVLESPVTVTNCGGTSTIIPSRNIIGALASAYLKDRSRDELFNSLFLNGDVVWSSLTPVIDNSISYPVPKMIVKLKNRNGEIINRFAKQKDDSWKSAKPKTIDSGYIAKCDNGTYVIADVPIRTVYHNSIKGRKENKIGLYSQDSIDEGYVYAGTVQMQGSLYRVIVDLLKKAEFSFGRSKSAQYSTCRLYGIKKPIQIKSEEVHAEGLRNGEPVFVVLRSDMIISGIEGTNLTENEIREILASKLGVLNVMPEGYMDISGYSTIGGFHSRWQLQKPHLQTVCAGSVFVFTAGESIPPAEIQVGSGRHEGYGICDVRSVEDMNKLVVFREDMVARLIEDYNDKNEAIIKLKSMVLSKVCEELISDNSKQIADELKRKKTDTKKKRKGIPQGRMRLILSESSCYAELRQKVDNIKESDKDSEYIGRQKECHEMLDMIYGEDKDKIDIKKMLGESRIAEELIKEMDDALRKHVLIDWKKPLDQVLHLLQYSKGGAR